MFQQPLNQIITEEVALDGLEGITFFDLCTRISQRTNISLPFSLKFQSSIWNLLVINPDFRCYLLPEPRKPLTVTTRDEFEENIDKIVGYIYNPIQNETERGSCNDYETRRPMNPAELLNFSLDDLGQSLVIVAAQNIREKLLIPNMLEDDLTLQQYCILEQIGRFREIGQTNTGPHSLAHILSKEKKGTMFYIIHQLIKKELITHQDLREGGRTQLVYHLPSRFVDVKNALQRALLRAVVFLKSKPNFTALLSELKEATGGNDTNAIKRMVNHQEFHNLVEKFEAPYRFYYPKATARQWSNPRTKTEKTLLLVRLKNTDLEPFDIFNSSKDFDEEKDDGGFLDSGNQIFGESLLRQVYLYLEMQRGAGASQSDIGRYLGVSQLQARALFKNITKLNYTETILVDEGRQRTQKIVIKKFYINSRTSTDSRFQNSIQHPSTSQEINSTPPSSLESLMMIDDDIEVIDPVHPLVVDPTGLDLSCIPCEIAFLYQIPNIADKVEGIRTALENNQLTGRLVKRCQIVVKITQMCKVISVAALLKTIQVHERRDGLQDTLDRKSLLRIINRLAVENLIKIIESNILFNDELHSFKFTCVPDISLTDKVVERAVDIHKARFVMKDVVRKHPLLNEAAISREKSNNSSKGRLQFSSIQFNEFKMAPKNVRMRNLHEFLFHGIYGIEVDAEPLSKESILPQWLAENPDIDPATLNRLPDIYYPLLCWRSFIAPFKSENGMYFLIEVIQNLPLSIFMTLSNVDLTIAVELKEIMEHPILRHTPIRYTNNVIRALLGLNHHLSYNIYLVATHLAYLGLLQFGPSMTDKERDKVFIYLNRRASLLDTTSSAPAYHLVENKEYPRIKFEFNTHQDVEEYWTTMLNICDETRLNSRKNIQNREQASERLHRKSALNEVLHSRTIDEMVAMDNGTVPGDMRGAAGFDSALYVHLRINWVRGKPTPKKYNKLASMIQKKITYKEAAVMKRRCDTKVKIMSRPVQRGHYMRSKVPNWTPPPPKRVRVVMYDEVDKKALQLMNSLRVAWSPEEDHILLTCRLATLYFFSTTTGIIKKIMSTVRDILHWWLRDSRMKTSRACARRINYVLNKQKDIKNVLYFCLAELRENANVTAQFGEDFIPQLKKMYSNEKDFMVAFKIHFTLLVYQLSHMYKSLTSVADVRDMNLSDTVQEFHQEFKTSTSDEIKFADDDPKEVIDIEKYILGCLIHSSLCSVSDKTSYNLQLYEVYKDYRDETLRSAMTILRKKQMVSMNKSIKTKHLEQSRSGSTMPLHLSITYVNQINTRITYDVFDEAFQKLFELGAESRWLNDNWTFQINTADSGTALLLAELMTKCMLSTKLDPPELVIKLDALQTENIASYERIYPRFREIIRHMKLNHKVVPLESISADTTTTSQTPAVAAGKKKIQFHEEVSIKYNRSPIELLFKWNDLYLHIFCLIKNLGADIHSQSIYLCESTGFCSATCVLQDQNPVESIVNLIKQFERQILNMKERRDRIKTDYLHKNYIINETTLAYFFDRFLERHRARLDAFNRKDFGKNLSFKPNSAKIIELCEDILLEAAAPVNWNRYMTKLEVTSLSIASEYNQAEDDDDDDEIFNNLTDKTLEKDAPPRNPDIFLVNLGKMAIKLNRGFSRSVTQFDNLKVPNCLLLLKQIDRDEVLRNIKESALWPTSPRSTTDLRRIMKAKNLSDVIKKKVEFVLDTIKLYGEVGVRAQDLLSITNLERSELQTCTDFLIAEKYILRTGVTNIIYVHYTSIRPWVVRSYNLKRLERESIPTDSSSLTNYRRGSASSSTLLPSTSESDYRSEFGKRVAAVLDVELEETERRSKRMKIETPAPISAVTPPRQTILIIPMPWIRINGSINRRVLDRWMGAVLLNLVQFPGTTLSTLGLRFSFLSLMQIRRLLDILVELKCVQVQCVKTKSKVGLFTKYEGVTTEPVSDFHAPEDIMISSLPDCLTKYSLFIGNKKYSTNFI